MWWLTSKTVKMKAQDLLSSRDLLLWNKPSQNNSTIYLIYLLVILQFGQFNSAPRVIGWGSSTKATGFRVPGFAHMTDTPAGVTEWQETGWVSFSPLPLSSFSNLASASLHGGQIPRGQKRTLQGLLRSKPISHAASFAPHSIGQCMSWG